MMANRKNNAEEKLAPDQEADNGSTAKPANTDAKMMIGATLKRGESALAGTMSSFLQKFKQVGYCLSEPVISYFHRTETILDKS